MIPYWFTSMTMKSVEAGEDGRRGAAPDQIPGLAEARPNAPAQCIGLDGHSLKEMVLPGLLVICSPIVIGIFFSIEAVSGY